ncbi:caprin-2-like [Argopecten irradians]|uniref:caprin-2-like n=1 Tax=Argopecten irradians TaxID=31199 RepID=UPI0037208FCE
MGTRSKSWCDSSFGENSDVTDHVTPNIKTVLLVVSDLTRQIEELKKHRLNDYEKILTLESKCEKLADENVRLSKRVETLESRPRYDDHQIFTRPVLIRPVDDVRLEVGDLNEQEMLRVRDTKSDYFTDTESVHKQTNRSTTYDRTDDKTGDNEPTRRIVQSTRRQIRSSSPDVSLRVAASADVAFSAYLSRLVLEPGDDYSIKFDHVVTNTGNSYNPTTGAFTCPKSGTYVFTWSVGMTHTGYIYSLLMKNGVRVGWSATADNNYGSMGTQTAVLVLSEGDVITVKFGTHTASSGLWERVTSFNGFIIH